MKQYVIDELRAEDYEKLKAYSDKTFGTTEINGIYRLTLDKEFLSDIQREHESECGPFYLALELELQKFTCELLVRPKNRIRCNCFEYANETQRNHIISIVDNIFKQLEIIT